MHGVTGKPPETANDKTGVATSRFMLLLLVAMTGVAPISLYMLVPALPLLATTFGRDISIAQMTVSLFMVGIACSQIIMGPLSDRFGRRPVILISCLGLFGLATYNADVHIKEIGVRKVLGASVAGIAALLSRDFIKLVLVSFLIAGPLAWWAMYKWLSTFNYHIAIGWKVFVLSGLLAIVIALLTVSYQAIKAALANPVKSLRSE